MLFLVIGFLLTALGLATLSHFSDWPGAERDSYFRNVGAAGGFLAILGLLAILYGARDHGALAVPSLAGAILTGAAAAMLLRKRRRTKVRDLVPLPGEPSTQPLGDTSPR